MGRLILVAALSMSVSGCLFVPSKVVGTSRNAASKPSGSRCKPSQEWDGQKCKHKGKGGGSRKHDD